MNDTFHLLEVDDESSPHAFLLTGIPALANASASNSTSTSTLASTSTSTSASGAVPSRAERERDLMATIAKGGLIDSESMVKTINDRLHEAPNGLGDRVQLFYIRFPLEK